MELELQTLISVVYTRIHSPEQISLLISHLGQPTATQVLKFKIGLCQKLISGLGLPMTGNTPKPQPKMRARVSKAVDRQEPVIADSSPTTRSSVPSASEVLRLFQAPLPETPQDNTSLTPLWYKYQLLLAYGTFQACLAPADKDSEWSKALSGTIPQIVRDVFQQKGSEASVYRQLLESQIVGWRRLIDVIQ